MLAIVVFFECGGDDFACFVARGSSIFRIEVEEEEAHVVFEFSEGILAM